MVEQLDKCPYYHGELKRNQAENRLRAKKEGSFLLRKSPNSFSIVLSVLWDSRIVHYNIERVEIPGQRLCYRINNGSQHPTPMDVINHYMKSKNGIKANLIFPVQNESTQKTIIKKFENFTFNHNKQPLLPPRHVTIERPSIRSFTWLHGCISREEDSERLTEMYKRCNLNGVFLVRQKGERSYVLSVVYEGTVHRYRILPEKDKFYVDGKQDKLYNSLQELIDYHKQNPAEISGIKCRLTRPCDQPMSANTEPEPQYINTDPPTPSDLPPRRPPRSPSIIALAAELNKLIPANSMDMKWSGNKTMRKTSGNNSSESLSSQGSSVQSRNIDLVNKRFKQSFQKKSCAKDMPGFFSPFQDSQNNNNINFPKEIFVAREDINIYEELGSGHFGAVHLGRCMIRGSGIPCAVKFLTGDDIEANKAELIDEAKVMQRLDHPHIVRLLGICDMDDLKIVMELAPMGTLRSCIRHRNYPTSQIVLLLKQVCEGMLYLSQQNVVHRDLAARNVLLVSENFAKVADFGMSRILQESECYYKSTNPGMWPLRWYAPECLLYYKFSSKADVWSYGITMWESLTQGKKPYQDMTGREVMEFIENNQRLEKPPTATDDLYNIMLRCWTYDPHKRPSFADILPDITREHLINTRPPLILRY